MREALTYLSDRLTTAPDQRSGAIDLAGELGCAAALAQASAVIASSGMPCRDYRHYFVQRRAQLEAARGPAALSAGHAEQLALQSGGGCHRLLLAAGQSLDSARLTGPAVDWWRDLAADSDRILGPGHPDTVLAADLLADALLAAGQAAEAVLWFEWVLASRASLLGPDHPSTIEARVSLGRALVAAGQHGVLMPEYRKLGVLGHLVPGQHRKAAQQATYKQVDDRNDHSAMIPASPPAQARFSNRAPQVLRRAGLRGRQRFDSTPLTGSALCSKRMRRSAVAETPFTIGADARCTDGVCGKVIRVVVDPVARAVTHLVVQPRRWPGLGRLVPLDLVDAATPTEVRLRCTRAEFDELRFAEDTDFVPRANLDQYSGYSAEQMLMLPYYGRIAGEDMPQAREDEPKAPRLLAPGRGRGAPR